MRRAAHCPGIIAVALVGFAGCAKGLPEPSDSALVAIVPGTFKLGSTNACGSSCAADRLPREVKLTRGFQIEKREVTVYQYAACVAKKKCVHIEEDTDLGRKNRPVAVQRDQARTYCRAIGRRLPTEAEWEIAARSNSNGDLQAFPWGDLPLPCDQVPSKDCSGEREVSDVGTNVFDRTDTEISDLGGNLPEWVEDDYTSSLGCAGETTYAALCEGSPTCTSTRCTADKAGCVNGCVDGTAVKFCGAATEAATDPLHYTSHPVKGGGAGDGKGSPMYKGGGVALAACAADPGLRTRATTGQKVGFRCAAGSPTPSDLPPPTLTARIALQFPVPSCQSVKVQLASKDALPTSVTLETNQGRLTMTPGQAGEFTADLMKAKLGCATPLTNVLVVLHGAAFTTYGVTVKYDSGGGCSAYTTDVNLSEGETLSGTTQPVKAFGGC